MCCWAGQCLCVRLHQEALAQALLLLMGCWARLPGLSCSQQCCLRLLWPSWLPGWALHAHTLILNPELAALEFMHLHGRHSWSLRCKRADHWITSVHTCGSVPPCLPSDGCPFVEAFAMLAFAGVEPEPPL